MAINNKRPPYTRFKAYLQEQGISQKTLAILLGKTMPTISQNLNGRKGDLTVSEMRVICRQFGISADDYFVHPTVSREEVTNIDNNSARPSHR